MSNGTPVDNPGWQDIAGIFAPFTSQMMWRMNLGSYDDVAANAQIILLRIGMDMPPPPFPPLTAAQLQTFTTWVNNGCPEVPPAAPLSGAAPQAAAVAATAPTPSTRRVRFR